MKTQDNEFDELFRSKLDNYEEAPSSRVWPGIVNQLVGSKRKGLMLPLLSVAASLLILVTAGILFLPHIIKRPVRTTAAVSRTAMKGLPAIAIVKKDPGADAEKLPERGKVNVKTKSPNRYFAVHSGRALNAAKPEEQAPTKQQPEPIAHTEQLVVASIPQKQVDIIKPVVPGTETVLSVKTTPDESPGFKTQPALASQAPVINKKDIKPVKVKHKIHSFGDLINVVIAKVDKRKDKVIEFTDSDDDEATVTGVNLGLIKIKKDNK